MTRSKWLIVLGTYLVIGVGFYLGTKLTVDLSLTTLSSTESEEYKNYQAYTNKFPTQDATCPSFLIEGETLVQFTAAADLPPDRRCGPRAP